VPTNEESIRNLPGAFGATWSGFFANNASGDHVFATDSNGNLSITGTITANAGKIGGWDVNNTSLSKIATSSDSKYYRVRLYAPNNAQDSDTAISVGEANSAGSFISEFFKVKYDGSITATKATITGTIYADSGYFAGILSAATGSFSGMITANEGIIGGWEITNN